MSKISNLFNMNKDYTYIIAEVSQTHDGSLGQAHSFIDAAAESGADAIKFQTHIADEESTKDEPFRVPFSYEDNTRYDYWKRMEFTEDQWKGLFDHANSKNIDFLSSVFSVKALNMLDRIGIPAWKFGSGEVFNSILLEKALKTGKPVIISSGMSKLSDIREQIELIKKYGNNFVVLQCTTAYPCTAEKIGLNMIDVIRNEFDCLVGLSDHSGTIYPCLAATTIGASVVELHITLSKYMFGPDVSSSVNIDELKLLVNGVRFINTMRNNPVDKRVLSNELEDLKSIFSKSIYCSKNLAEESIISEGDLVYKKPAGGLIPSETKNIIGKRLKIRKLKDEIFNWSDFYE